MSKLNLKDYTWEIFQISVENDTYLELGAQLFLANIKAGENILKGANINYNELKKQWDSMSPNEHQVSTEELNKIISSNSPLFEDLMEAWANDDRNEFEKLIGN